MIAIVVISLLAAAVSTFLISWKVCPKVKLIPWFMLSLSFVGLATKVQFIQYLFVTSSSPRSYTLSECGGLQFTSPDISHSFYAMGIVDSVFIVVLLLVNWIIATCILYRSANMPPSSELTARHSSLNQEVAIKSTACQTSAIKSAQIKDGSATILLEEEVEPNLSLSFIESGNNLRKINSGSNSILAENSETLSEINSGSRGPIKKINTSQGLLEIGSWEKTTDCCGKIVIGVITFISGLDITHLFLMQSQLCNLKVLSAPFEPSVVDFIDSLDKLSLLILETPFLCTQVKHLFSILYN